MEEILFTTVNEKRACQFKRALLNWAKENGIIVYIKVVPRGSGFSVITFGNHDDITSWILSAWATAWVESSYC